MRAFLVWVMAILILAKHAVIGLLRFLKHMTTMPPGYDEAGRKPRGYDWDRDPEGRKPPRPPAPAPWEDRKYPAPWGPPPLEDREPMCGGNDTNAPDEGLTEDQKWVR